MRANANRRQSSRLAKLMGIERCAFYRQSSALECTMAASQTNIIISAFTEEQAARLTGLSAHRLRYWDRTRFFCPAYADENRRAAYSRIYSFMDIAALRVLSVLINQYDVRLQNLRETAQKLGSMDNGAWSRCTLYVLHRKVYFEDPQDGNVRDAGGQYAIPIVLEKVVSDTKRDVKTLSARMDAKVGKIERRRFVSDNAPVIAGTRIPVSVVKEFHEDGYSVAQIMKQYPTLTEQDIVAAIAFPAKEKAA
jgi:DNA-binding transcriptional MerR regulator